MEQRAKGVPFKEIALKLGRTVRGVNLKYYRLCDAGDAKPAAHDTASKAQGGKGILPRPCPDENWSIEDDLDLVSEHHRGLSMLDVSIMLERTKADCVARYNALIEAMPEGEHTKRQIRLKNTLTYHATLGRAA